MGDTLATADGYLKRFYGKGLNDQVNSMRSIYRRIDKNTDDVRVAGSSLKAFLHSKFGRNQGRGWRAENGTLPTAKNITTKQPEVGLAYNYGVMELTGPLIKASEKDAYAISNFIDAEMEDIREGLEVDINRALAGRGTGALAKITAATATPQAASTLFAVDDASRLEEGMVVEMWSTNAGSGGTQTAGTPTIEAVDRVNNNISFTAAQNITQNDFIYMEGSRGNQMMGFEGAIDGLDSAGARILASFQNITRASFPIYDANVIDNGGADIALNLIDIQRAFETGEIVGGETCTLIESDYTSRNAYREILSVDKRYVGTLDLDGGWTALEYTGGGTATPWVADRHCLKKRIFFINEPSFSFYLGSSGPVEFMQERGSGSVLLRVSGKDAYNAVAFLYIQLGCKKPNANTVLRDRVA